MARVCLGLATVLVIACRPSEFDGLVRGRTEPDAHAPRVPEAAGEREAGESEPPVSPEPANEALDGGTPEGDVMDAEAKHVEAGVEPPSTRSGAAEGGPEGGPAVGAETGPSNAPEPTKPSVPEVNPPPVCLNDANETTLCGCSNDCLAVNSVASCISGRCVRACQPDFDDCNHDLAKGQQGDGCETDLRTNDTSCAHCGQACTTQQARFVGCEDKVCKPLDVKLVQLRGLGNKCLDVEGPSTANATRVQIWSCGDQLPQQEWAFTPAGELRGLGNKCLDVQGPSHANGTPVQLWDCVRAPQQTWKLNQRGQLVGFENKCLQVIEGKSEDGQNLELWDCLDIPAQRWSLVEL